MLGILVLLDDNPISIPPGVLGELETVTEEVDME